MTKYVLGAVAAIALVASLPAYAQMNFRYNGPWESPEQNVIRSAHYDWLLETHPGFRAYRMRKECSPIDFEQSLRQDCFQSFNQFEPMR